MAQGNYSHLPGLLAGAFIWQRIAQTASKTSGQVVSVQNPEGTNATQAQGGFLNTVDTVGEVVINRAMIIVKTPPTLDVVLDLGVGAAATTDAVNLITALTIKAGTVANTVYDNLQNPGASGKPLAYMSPSAYFNVTVASGDANGLVADVLAFGVSNTGGP